MANVRRQRIWMLIALSFSPSMVARCRWINPDIRISLIQYQYVGFTEIGEDTLIFIPQEITLKPRPLVKKREFSELFEYIKDNRTRKIAKQFLDEIVKLSSNISIDPLQWGRSVKYKGNVLFYWEPRQSSIRISY